MIVALLTRFVIIRLLKRINDGGVLWISSKVKRLRQANGLTLEELANRSELTKGFLSQLERDLTSPSVATLEDILEALGTNAAESSLVKRSGTTGF